MKLSDLRMGTRVWVHNHNGRSFLGDRFGRVTYVGSTAVDLVTDSSRTRFTLSERDLWAIEVTA